MRRIIGLTKDYEIVVADVKCEKFGPVYKKVINVSFELSKIERVDDVIRNADYMKKYYKGLLECYPADTIVALCNEYNCPPYQLAEKMAESINDKSSEELVDEDILDCHLYPHVVDVDGEDYIFISTGYIGPLDTEIDDEMLEIVSPALYDDICAFQKNYNLKDINNNIEPIYQYETIVGFMDRLDDKETISNFVRKYDL